MSSGMDFQRFANFLPVGVSTHYSRESHLEVSLLCSTGLWWSLALQCLWRPCHLLFLLPAVQVTLLLHQWFHCSHSTASPGWLLSPAPGSDIGQPETGMLLHPSSGALLLCQGWLAQPMWALPSLQFWARTCVPTPTVVYLSEILSLSEILRVFVPLKCLLLLELGFSSLLFK